MSFIKDKLFWLFVLLGAIAVFILSLIKTNYALFWYLNSPLQLFNLIIVSAVVEEIIFRGAIFGLLVKKLNSKQTIIITSILFSIAHIFLHSPLWALLVFFPGILYGVLRDSHGTPVSAIFLHLIYNLMYFSLYEF